MAVVTSLGFSIFSRYDNSGVNRAQRDIRRLESSLKQASVTSNLLNGALMLSPAVIPIIGAAAGATLQLANAMGVAGAATAVFGLAAKNQLGKVHKAMTDLTALEKRHHNAVVTGNAKQIAATAKLIKDLKEHLDPAQTQALHGMQRLSEAWHNFGGTARKEVLGTAVYGMDLLTKLLKNLEPAVKPIAGAFLDIAKTFSGPLKSGISGFSKFLAQTGPGAVKGFATVIAHIVHGFVGIFKSLNQFDRGGKNTIAVLIRLSARFDKFGNSGSIIKLLKYANQQMPSVIAFFTALGNAVMHFTTAIAPVGPVILHVITPMLQMVDTIIVKFPFLIRYLWMVYAAYRALSIILPIVNGLLMKQAGENGVVSIISKGKAGVVVAVLIAIGVAIWYLYHRVAWFRAAWDATWKFIATVVQIVWTQIKADAVIFGNIFLWLWQNVLSPFVSFVATYVVPNLLLAWNFLWAGAKIAFAGIAAAVRWLWTALTAAFNGIRAAVLWLAPLWGFLWGVIKFYGQAIMVVFNLLFFAAKVYFWAIKGLILNVLAPVFRWLWENVIRPVFGFIAAAARVWWNALRLVFGSVKSFIQTVFAPVWRWLYNNAVKPAFDSILGRGHDLANGMKSVWNALKVGMKAVVDGWTAGKNAIAKVWQGIQNASRNPVKFLIDTVWNHGIVKIWNAVISKVPGIGSISEVAVPKGLRSGGIVGGNDPGRRDNVFMPMRSGEGVLVPEVVRALGADFIHGLNYLGNTRGSNGVRGAFAGGLGTYGAIKGREDDQATWWAGVLQGRSDAHKAAMARSLAHQKHMAHLRHEKALRDAQKPWFGPVHGGTQAEGAGYPTNRSYVPRKSKLTDPFAGLAMGGIVGQMRAYAKAPKIHRGGQTYVAGQPPMEGLGLGGIVGDIVGGAKNLWSSGFAKMWGKFANPVVNKLKAFGGPNTFGGIPYDMAHGLVAAVGKKLTGAANSVSGGAGSKGVLGALQWAKSQWGKPYEWGGSGNPSWDCSGYMAAIQKKIDGGSPGRLYTTMDFNGSSAPAGYVRGLKAPFMVGVTNAGVGHMAGTLAGINVESSGGAGVHGGKGVPRGYNDGLFGAQYGYRPSMGNVPLGNLKGFKRGGHMRPGEWGVVGDGGGPELFQAGRGGGTVTPIAAGVTLIIEGDVYTKSSREFEDMVNTAISELKRKRKLT